MKKMKMVLIVAGIFCAAQVCSAATIMSDDFSTDPASRWTTTQADGTYGWSWAYPGWDPGVYGGNFTLLPKPGDDAPCMYTFSQNWKAMMTNDTTPVTQSYTVSTDFKVKGSLGAWFFGQVVQRQSDNALDSWVAFSVGGNGTIVPGGLYGGTGGYSTAPLELDRWYTLITSVNIGASSTGIQS